MFWRSSHIVLFLYSLLEIWTSSTFALPPRPQPPRPPLPLNEDYNINDYVYIVTASSRCRRLGFLETSGRYAEDVRYTYIPRQGSVERIRTPLAYRDPVLAVQAWASMNVRSQASPYVIVLRRGPYTTNGPLPGTLYQPGFGWPRGLREWYARFDLYPEEVRDMSYQEIHTMLASLRWGHLRPACVATVAQVSQLLQDQRGSHESQTHTISGQAQQVDSTETVEEYICSIMQRVDGNAYAPIDCDEATVRSLLEGSFQPQRAVEAAQVRQLESLCADTNAIGAAWTQEQLQSQLQLQPEPQPQQLEPLEPVAQSPSQSQPQPQQLEPVAGPSSLCQQRIAKALQPVRAKSKGQKRPLSEMATEAQQAVCTAGRGVTSMNQDQPPAKKAADARCEQIVAQYWIDDFGNSWDWNVQDSLQPSLLEDHLCSDPEMNAYLVNDGTEPQEQADQDETSPPPVLDQDQTPWSQFAQQVQQRFAIAEQQLRIYMDTGIQLIHDNYPEIYDLLQHSFPTLMDIMQQMAHAAIQFTTCQNDLCKKLRIAIGESDPDVPQIKNDKTTLEAAGTLLDTLRRVVEGKFDGLDCAAIFKKLQSLSGPGERDFGQVGGKQQYCERARKLLSCESLSKGLNAKAPPTPVKVVFYADFLWPTEAKKIGGFLPPDSKLPGPTYEFQEGPTLESTTPVDWGNEVVQTHLYFGLAAQEAAKKAAKNTNGFHGVVYAIHATPNIVVSGRHHSLGVGGILWSQVLGWVQVPLNYTLPEFNPQEQTNTTLQQYFEEAFKAQGSLIPGGSIFQQNSDYDHKFNEFTASIDDDLNLNLPQNLWAFMDEKGSAVGWRGKFPLFEPAERITAQLSEAAKAAKAITTPHEPSFWNKVGHFMDSHAIAIGLLPFVALANLIPGVGEIADAAEVAALSTETVEGIELTELSSEEATELSPLLQSGTKLKGD
ncbi:hypothetical protein ED733_007193 [Metarhizium rileyi]|uniref:Heat-labile enterotoxin, A chain n=1 Tax=Metarhizium rileyi (strain RCEF 4871) TaxID=1649241 RepID=A0A5C6GI83_METRR|nr:hypothetical protein ED733_007193 [Metarhizium rileyi]